MSKIRYALGMLATGAMAGVATHAAASTVGGGPPVFVFTPPDDEITADHTLPFNYDVQFGTGFLGSPLTIFSYHGDGQTNHLTTGTKEVFGDLAHFNSQAFATGALPSSSETFDQTDITTWTSPSTPPDPWYHVEFTVLDQFSPVAPPSIQTYLGTIQIDAKGNQELDQMLYTPLSVPEPEVWALMILGMGATGAALRSRRRALAA